MRENKVLVYVVVIVLGIAAAILSFAAEASRTKVSDLEVRQYGCNYPSTSVTNKFGYIAAALLLTAQIIICTTISRCVCCQTNASYTISFSGDAVNFIISSVAAAIGIILLVCAPNFKIRSQFSNGTIVCYTVRPGMFGMAGTLAIIATVLGLTAYSASTKHRAQPPPTMDPLHHQGEIAMGYPQLSATTYPKQQQYV